MPNTTARRYSRPREKTATPRFWSTAKISRCGTYAARANTDLIFEQVSEYRRAAIDWLEKVAGLKGTDKPLAPGLPLLKTEDGEVRITARMGSRRKFRHGFDD